MKRRTLYFLIPTMFLLQFLFDQSLPTLERKLDRLYQKGSVEFLIKVLMELKNTKK
ncbi:hypothetical protein SAMN04488057_102140 [Cyclobacterium lianum]|uniref:Uncharacterized protein n=1 Tax=Cyclobacterium lianum TaxID=388280 RepID=A0A1M7JS44_9BACT|nr:hypothetical protein SAMN04488057_102140 [Cyclobacterium lianum]